MKRRVLVIALAAALVAACGSSAGSGGTTASTAQNKPTPSVSAIATCDELKVAAAHLTTFLHYVALDVGTDNDPSSYVTEMRDTVASLEANQRVCTGDAQVQLAALRQAVEVLSAAYQPGSGAQPIAVDKAAIAAFAAVGRAAYTALGMDPSPWDTAARYSV